MKRLRFHLAVTLRCTLRNFFTLLDLGYSSFLAGWDIDCFFVYFAFVRIFYSSNVLVPWRNTAQLSHFSPSAEGRNYLAGDGTIEVGPFRLIDPLFDSSLPSSAVRMLQLIPRSHPNEVGVSSQTGHTLVATSDPSKRLLFGQKQIVYSVFLLCSYFLWRGRRVLHMVYYAVC